MEVREASNARQRAWRKANGNISTKRYEKTPKGFLMRTYRNMESRVRGIQKKKFHLYVGKELLSREDFYAWSLNQFRFWDLFNEWVENGYDRKLTPSIDRIDSSRGYTLDNMRWLTHSENSRLGAINRNHN